MKPASAHPALVAADTEVAAVADMEAVAVAVAVVAVAAKAATVAEVEAAMVAAAVVDMGVADETAMVGADGDTN